MNFRHGLSFAGCAALALVPLLRGADVAGDLVFTSDVPGGVGMPGGHDAVKAAAAYSNKEDKPAHRIFGLIRHGREAKLAANLNQVAALKK
jgi:hypothetical protein